MSKLVGMLKNKTSLDNIESDYCILIAISDIYTRVGNRWHIEVLVNTIGDSACRVAQHSSARRISFDREYIMQMFASILLSKKLLLFLVCVCVILPFFFIDLRDWYKLF